MTYELFGRFVFLDVFGAMVVHSVAVGWPMNCMLCFMGTLALFLLFSLDELLLKVRAVERLKIPSFWMLGLKTLSHHTTL